ncbi:MAG: dTMP kinase [Rhodobacteraceae bacterium]|nr:dTMP kinase [Paracoccaceae bacterium]
MMSAGTLITLDGIDGTGKSSQAKRLSRSLDDRGYDVLLTREPGGTRGAESIRELILSTNDIDWSPASELLLFFAARCNHVEQVIRPALAAGTIVVCDRFTDSTRVYQSLSPEADAVLEAINAHLVRMEPDLTLILRSAPELAQERVRHRGAVITRFEKGDAHRHAKRADAFDRILARFPERCVAIDADRDPECVAGDILACVLERLGGGS